MSNETRVTLLTGCSRGIGLAIAHFLLKRNPIDKVFAIARSAGSLQELKEQYPGQVEYITADLADLSARFPFQDSESESGRKGSRGVSEKDESVADQAVRQCLDKFGRLDSLILNHGVLTPVTRLEHSNATDWRAGFDVNFFSCVAFVKSAIPYLRETKGNVILTSSGAALNGYGSWGAYGSSKAAMNHLAMTLAAEEKAITALAIRPGVVATDMQKEIREVHQSTMDPTDAAKFKELHEEGQLLKPEQPGHVIAKLALEAPKELSGKFLSWNSPELAAFQE